jgi:hypothetical protein
MWTLCESELVSESYFDEEVAARYDGGWQPEPLTPTSTTQVSLWEKR